MLWRIAIIDMPHKVGSLRTVRNVDLRIEKLIQSASWSGVPAVYDSEPLSRSATIKGGQAGAREPMFTVPTVPTQTLTT
jgi:hypothetical protein